MKANAFQIHCRGIPFRPARRSLHRLCDCRDILLSSTRPAPERGGPETEACNTLLDSTTQSRRRHARRRVLPSAQTVAPKCRTCHSPEPERGVVEIKPADYNLDTLTHEPQTLRYLKQYGLVLITNLREFRLLQLTSAGTVQTLERYTLALHRQRCGPTHSLISTATPISCPTSWPASCSIARRSSSQKT